MTMLPVVSASTPRAATRPPAPMRLPTGAPARFSAHDGCLLRGRRFRHGAMDMREQHGMRRDVSLMAVGHFGHFRLANFGNHRPASRHAYLPRENSFQSSNPISECVRSINQASYERILR